MRTTLDIDDDVMLASRDLAARRRTSVGAIVSELARNSLNRSTVAADADNDDDFPALPKRGLKQPITLELVNRLREELDC